MSFRVSFADRQKSTRTSGVGGTADFVDFADAGSLPLPPVEAAAEPPVDFGPVAATATTALTQTTTATTGTRTVSATSTTTVSATYLPSWVATLKTAAIKSDVTAAVADGTITYAELVKVFSNVASALTSSKTTLSATQFADLKTLVADLSVGVTTSSYLIAVANSLVNGSKANATWTGGDDTAVTLGNLASGSSVTQVNQLIGKWLLGTDLPSSKVSMSGVSTFSVSYSTVSKPLFATSGPTMGSVNQGYLGDCYLLAGLAEVADQNSSLIKSMFVDNGNGTWGVRFYVNGTATWVTVNSALANGGNVFNYGGSDIWASLAEKAYAQLQASGVVTGNVYNYGNSWSTIGNGGAPEYALAQITGATQITDFSARNGVWTCNVYNSSMSRVSYATGISNASVLATLVARINAGDDVVLSSHTNAKDASGKTTLVAGHAMSVYGYNAATGLLQIRNPWGTASGQTWATTFEVSLSTLLAAGDVISVDNAKSGKTVTTATAALVSGTTSTLKAFTDAAETAFDTASDTLASADDTTSATFDATATLFAQSMAAMTGDDGTTANLVASLAAASALQLVSPTA